MFSKIDQYMENHKNAWAKTTKRDRVSLLRTLEKRLFNPCKPEEVHQDLEVYYQDYSIKTCFSILTNYYQWLLDQGHKEGKNVFAEYRRRNALKFKNVYQRKPVEKTFEEAKLAIEGMPNSFYRQAAMQLLLSGLRVSELGSISNGKVRGKGSKIRDYFGPCEQVGKVCAVTLRTHLREIGLKPHDLRKLFATQLSNSGMSPEDLCEVMGWSSIGTAFLYLQPSKKQVLKSKIDLTINQEV